MGLAAAFLKQQMGEEIEDIPVEEYKPGRRSSSSYQGKGNGRDYGKKDGDSWRPARYKKDGEFKKDSKFKKVIVGVMVKVSPEGEIRPINITYTDGITYEIDRLKQRCRAHATKVGGTGIRYTIVVGKKETSHFEDEG